MPSLTHTWAMWALVVPSETSRASRYAEVFGIDGEPILHLYGAGELGGRGTVSAAACGVAQNAA